FLASARKAFLISASLAFFETPRTSYGSRMPALAAQGSFHRMIPPHLSPGEGLALHPVNIGTIQPGRDSDSPRFFATGIQGALRLCDERNRREPRRQRDRATERSDGAV